MGPVVRAALITAMGVLCAFAFGPAATVASAAQGRGAVGTLAVQVEGLPRGERAQVSVVGPSQGRGEGRFTESVTRSGVTRFRGLKAGKYTLKVAPVEVKRRHGVVRQGAIAYPVRRKLRIRVKSGRTKPARIRYGTIRNPGVKELQAGRVLKVIGARRDPKGLLLRGDPGYRRGTLLTAGPSEKLPRGLVARVTSARLGAKTKVMLRSATIYEVAPSMTFRTKLDVEPVASASAAVPLTCGGGSSVDPLVRFSDVWADGGWITSNVWLAGDVPSGAWLNLDFDSAIGIDMAVIGGVTCSLDLTDFVLKGKTKGRSRIPLYGAIKSSLNGSIGAGAKMNAGGSVRVKLGAWAEVLPPGAGSSVGFERPKFEVSAEAFSEVGLSFALDAEIGVGIEDGDNVHARFGNSLDFGVGGGRCALDLNLGAFSIAGKVWKWKIVGPSAPPRYHRNLWQTTCAPPPLPVPATRAQIAWTGDADVDLYAWDEAGRLTYFGDRTGIPDTKLVEDVIPDDGQVNHEGETFLETANPGRRYTLGVCLFRGDPTSVTMTVPSVPDPRGVPRILPVHLPAEGAGVVVATSPEGGGYSPPPDWCRSVAN